MSKLPFPSVSTSPMRTQQLRARAPRIALLVLVTILALGGLRNLVAPRPTQRVVARAAAPVTSDLVLSNFAEGFVRAYLSWDDEDPDERGTRLAAYVGGSISADAGMTPPPGSEQTVVWTAVESVQRPSRTSCLVTVTAQLGDGRVMHVSVPVARDRRGFTSLAGYPALVGPPAVNVRARAPQGDVVEDGALSGVVGRAVTNYLAGARANLAADLTPDARVSLPAARMTVSGRPDLQWVVPGRRVAATVRAVDEQQTAWTLRYEADVRRSDDRWYLRTLQIDPTSTGA